MIKKFEEYISEGFWKDSIRRAAQNSLRIEDVFSNTNVDSLEQGSFTLRSSQGWHKGFFAENDIYYPSGEKKERLFTEKDMKRIVDYVKKDKWRLPTYDDIKDMLFNGDELNYAEFSFSVKYFNQGGGVITITRQSGVKFPKLRIPFGKIDNLPIEYWLADGYMTIGLKYINNRVKRRRSHRVEIKLYKEHTNTPKRIRLYKGWKEVSEGFWKDSIRRSQSGEKRIEDLTEFDKYFKNIEWVDMGHNKVLFAKYDFNYGAKTADDLLSCAEIDKIYKSLPDDVEIMNASQLNWLKICDSKLDDVDDDHSVLKTYAEFSKDWIEFEDDAYYYLQMNKYNKDEHKQIYIGLPSGFNLLRKNVSDPNDPKYEQEFNKKWCFIKLVKKK